MVSHHFLITPKTKAPQGMADKGPQPVSVPTRACLTLCLASHCGVTPAASRTTRQYPPWVRCLSPGARAAAIGVPSPQGPGSSGPRGWALGRHPPGPGPSLFSSNHLFNFRASVAVWGDCTAWELGMGFGSQCLGFKSRPTTLGK